MFSYGNVAVVSNLEGKNKISDSAWFRKEI
jgi:hypothetical protein